VLPVSVRAGEGLGAWYGWLREVGQQEPAPVAAS
jgi:hypothetical protein